MLIVPVRSLLTKKTAPPPADKPRADHLEPAATDEDRAAATPLGLVAHGVAVGEGQVLHGELRGLLVLAVRGRPALRLVAGVLVEDRPLPAAAEQARHEFLWLV